MFTSPRQQRALKRITVDMDKHQEMLNRLNEQSNKIAAVRKASPFKQGQAETPTRGETKEAPLKSAAKLGSPCPVAEQKSRAAVFTQERQRLDRLERRLDADAAVALAAAKVEAAAASCSRKLVEDEEKEKPPAAPVEEAKAPAEEVDEADEEDVRLRAEEGALKAAAVAAAARVEAAAARVEAAAAAKKPAVAKKKVWVPTSTPKNKEEKKWYESPKPAVEYTSETREPPETRPTMSAYRTGWSSTPSVNNKDAYVRPTSGFTSSGQYAWNHFLPKPKRDDADDDDDATTNSPVVVMETVDETPEPTPLKEEKAPEPPPRDYDEPAEENLETESESDSDDERQPTWQQTARRRSDHRRATFGTTTADKQDDYDERDKLVDEDLAATRVAEHASRLLASDPLAVQRATKVAVSEACRTVATEDLDAEVTSFDLATGLYRIECKIKIADGRVVAMAVLRDLLDFIKIRNDLLACLDRIPGGRAIADRDLKKIPKKRLRSLLVAKGRNMIKGKKTGDLKWQAKQLPMLATWLDSAITIVTKVKSGPIPLEPGSRSKFSFVSDFGGLYRLDLEDHLKCFLLQSAFFTGVLTMAVSSNA
ncbi:hypothetical protein CTAYLR_001465 [Chrysophaeum taylorii]|uniref:Uncharacterized protein n=1 Tax=Chrysophaeum taylorii TaxID=2483200 RepID=A0AAD7XLJ4_9STRA|nr:hypothetical protein CTAYLR_001465 [Chrysophaeum taylorii]